uniref:U1-buthitoxin-Hj1b n=1 Tax=Hottentotta judaicus TaxID=6863 RepID=F1CJ50_HOTJU|nr:U1-buthitoxin-Hj1b [Hottentotta judaicus]
MKVLKMLFLCLILLTSISVIKLEKECIMQSLSGDFPRQNNGHLYVCTTEQTCQEICKNHGRSESDGSCCYGNCFCKELHGKNIIKRNNKMSLLKS